MRLSKRPASAARISCAKEQPSRCLLHADWMMLNNALLQVPNMGEETGAYSHQWFIYWLAWCEVYGAWQKPDIWIPCMVLERSNWGGIDSSIFFHASLYISNKQADSPLVWAPCGRICRPWISVVEPYRMLRIRGKFVRRNVRIPSNYQSNN